MSICKSCGGIIGVDCFNPQECAWISEQQERAKQQSVGYCSICEYIHLYEIEKRRREAAEEVIKYMSESGMSIVPWNEVYKSWQSIKEEADHE